MSQNVRRISPKCLVVSETSDRVGRVLQGRLLSLNYISYNKTDSACTVLARHGTSNMAPEESLRDAWAYDAKRATQVKAHRVTITRHLTSEPVQSAVGQSALSTQWNSRCTSYKPAAGGDICENDTSTYLPITSATRLMKFNNNKSTAIVSSFYRWLSLIALCIIVRYNSGALITLGSRCRLLLGRLLSLSQPPPPTPNTHGQVISSKQLANAESNPRRAIYPSIVRVSSTFYYRSGHRVSSFRCAFLGIAFHHTLAYGLSSRSFTDRQDAISNHLFSYVEHYTKLSSAALNDRDLRINDFQIIHLCRRENCESYNYLTHIFVAFDVSGTLW
ncbi:hypothetical protein J6590_057560 [Homalodisca vitripennis]|nr:hypothetical protein J6590_057560 [Homalodisca vitripennis]